MTMHGRKPDTKEKAKDAGRVESDTKQDRARGRQTTVPTRPAADEGESRTSEGGDRAFDPNVNQRPSR